MIFEKGDVVITPGGQGTVVYRRMAAPDYNTVAAYSVKLDRASNDPTSSASLATIYSAEDVKPVEKITGSSVYRKMMDVELLFQDILKMSALRMFLDSIREDHPSLIKLNEEVETFKSRIEQLVAASEGK